MPITIGMPFYNAEEYLVDAIRSVFAQTYQDWELILVDDGSTDRSLEIARSVNDLRVRVISDGQNRKLSYRLNQITSEAKFDLIGRMDADDLISPTRFAKQLAILEAHQEIDLVTTGVCSITNDNRPVGMRCGSHFDTISGRKLLLGQCAIVHAAMLGRRSWFLRNPYNTLIPRAQDSELWLRAYSKNDFSLYVLGEPLYYYREEVNVTAEKLLISYRSKCEMLKEYGYLGLDRWEVPLMVAKFQVKSLLVKFLSICNRMDILIKRRNSRIDEFETNQNFNQEIMQILQTPVPGIN